MKKQFMKLAMGLFVFGVLATSCKKDKVEEPNEEEIITTMKLTFVPVGGGTTLTYQFRDPDGAGGTAPTQDEIVLEPTKTYNVSVLLLNETVAPAKAVALEVAEEADAHRFYYEAQAASNIAVSGLNTDGNGVPVGITSTWTTGTIANGKIKVTLRHYGGTPPGKAADDLVNSSKSNTDIEVEFDTKIQ